MCRSMVDIQSLTAEIRWGKKELEMWANDQRDGRPAEYKWRPLFNAAKFGRCPLLECHAVTLPGRETRWNLQGTRQQISAASRLWGRHCCLTSSFPIVDTCFSCEDIARQRCGMVPRWRLFGDFLRSASRVQHVSDLHSKFTLRPHHVWKYGRQPISDRWD